MFAVQGFLGHLESKNLHKSGLVIINSVEDFLTQSCGQSWWIFFLSLCSERLIFLVHPFLEGVTIKSPRFLQYPHF